MGLFGNKNDSENDIFSRLGKEEREDMMVNTLDDPELSRMASNMKKEAMAGGTITNKLEEQLNNESKAIDSYSREVAKDEQRTELEQMSDETAVITAGLVVSGNLDSVGSIDIFGTVNGDVTCSGKLTVSGTITGFTDANEVFANNAQITGDIQAKGSVKIGQGTVVIGDITATSAVIAGAVKGNVDVNGPIVIDSSAVIVGDIKSKSMQINNGATIDGRCSQEYAEVDVESIFNIVTEPKKTDKKPDNKSNVKPDNKAENKNDKPKTTADNKPVKTDKPEQ